MNYDTKKQIRFIDSHYNELFRINNGDKVKITMSDGRCVERVCKYIDDYHLKVGNNIYHICQFAQLMERNKNKIEPLSKEKLKRKNKSKSIER